MIGIVSGVVESDAFPKRKLFKRRRQVIVNKKNVYIYTNGDARNDVEDSETDHQILGLHLCERLRQMVVRLQMQFLLKFPQNSTFASRLPTHLAIKNE